MALPVTRNAAVVCGLAGEVGTIEPGKYADLVGLSGNPMDDIRALIAQQAQDQDSSRPFDARLFGRLPPSFMNLQVLDGHLAQVADDREVDLLRGRLVARVGEPARRHALIEDGHEVAEAEDGHEAIQKTQDHAPDAGHGTG